jgi:hypothetical protein
MDPFAPDDVPPLTPSEWREQRSRIPLIDLLKDSGVSFPPETEVQYTGPSSTLTITNNPSNLELIEALFTQLAMEESKARANGARTAGPPQP